MSEEEGGRATPAPGLHHDTVQVATLVSHQDPVSGQTEDGAARLLGQVVLTEETEENNNVRPGLVGTAADQVLPEVWE